MLPRPIALALGVVIDIALGARAAPMAARALAARSDLPPRHLEAILQTLAHAGILKGVRGPRGGYRLARERRRLTAGDVARAMLGHEGAGDADPSPALSAPVVAMAMAKAAAACLAELDALSIETLCHAAEKARKASPKAADFAI